MKFASLLKNVAAPGRSESSDVVAGLSAEQAAALRAPPNKSAAICAGAGAGKTKLLVERVTRLLKLGANPQRMAVVTFTRKAADEMRARLHLRLGAETRMPRIGTVHALALAIASRRKLDFVLASDEQLGDVLAAVRECLPEDYEADDSDLQLMLDRARETDDTVSLVGMAAEVFEQELLARGLGDFTSLLLRVADDAPAMFDHVIVDEAQDLSPLQLRFLRRVGAQAQFWFIGDPDQAIYSFRGAHAGMMQRLVEESALRFDLLTNFRSARAVVAHASNVVSNNPGRLALSWVANRPDAGEVAVQFFETDVAEAQFVRDWLSAAPAGSRCVLARTRAQVQPFLGLPNPAMTVHESKGLEWDDVLVLGCEAALFPHPLAGLQEERRLFYVAMTRARNTLRLTACQARTTKNGKLTARAPSRFLFETQALEAKS